MTALLNGKRVRLIGEVYEPPKHSPGRQWTMVQEVGCKWWKPAFMDELKEIPVDRVVYLCGPINGCTDEECSEWRSVAKHTLNCLTLDPMRRDYRGREDECVAEIVELDKIDVENSDVLLVNYDKPSVGTSMEVLYAWELEKLVVVVARPGTVISPWLRYHSHHLVSTFEEAFRLIEGSDD